MNEWSIKHIPEAVIWARINKYNEMASICKCPQPESCRQIKSTESVVGWNLQKRKKNLL